MARLPVISLILFSTVLLAACSAAGGAERRVNAPSDGQVIEVGVGDELVLELAGNPTTGYNWEVGEIDGSIIEQVGEADFKADSALIGSGGVVTLTFTGVAPGEAHLKLVYHKSWEADVAPLEEFNITIHVK